MLYKHSTFAIINYKCIFKYIFVTLRACSSSEIKKILPSHGVLHADAAVATPASMLPLTRQRSCPHRALGASPAHHQVALGSFLTCDYPGRVPSGYQPLLWPPCLRWKVPPLSSCTPNSPYLICPYASNKHLAHHIIIILKICFQSTGSCHFRGKALSLSRPQHLKQCLVHNRNQQIFELSPFYLFLLFLVT